MTIDMTIEQANKDMEKHWASRVGAKTAEEQKAMDELVNATYPMNPSLGAATSGDVLVSDGRGATWISTAICPTKIQDPLWELEARVKVLEARVSGLERARSDMGKSEWDKFEELSSGI